jgi:hypothetical protein
MKDENVVGLGAEFKPVSRLVNEMGNIDPRQRVRTFDDEQSARLQVPQGLAGPQHW